MKNYIFKLENDLTIKTRSSNFIEKVENTTIKTKTKFFKAEIKTNSKKRCKSFISDVSNAKRFCIIMFFFQFKINKVGCVCIQNSKNKKNWERILQFCFCEFGSKIFSKLLRIFHESLSRLKNMCYFEFYFH